MVAVIVLHGLWSLPLLVRLASKDGRHSRSNTQNIKLFLTQLVVHMTRVQLFLLTIVFLLADLTQHFAFLKLLSIATFARGTLFPAIIRHLRM